jgi:hypothetical protein
MAHQILLETLADDGDTVNAPTETDAIRVRMQLGLAIRGVGQNKENGVPLRYLEEVTIPSIQAGCKRLIDEAEEKIKETIRRYHERTTTAS